jgi:hypothetical protein
MKCIQCFGGVGANIVEVSQEFIDSNTSDYQTYVLYDDIKHASFRPRDRVTTEGVDSTQRVVIEAAVITLASKVDEYEKLAENPLTTQLQLDAKQLEIDLAVKAVSDAEKLNYDFQKEVLNA